MITYKQATVPTPVTEKTVFNLLTPMLWTWPCLSLRGLGTESKWRLTALENSWHFHSSMLHRNLGAVI